MRHTLWVTSHLSHLPKEIYDKLMGSVCASELNTPCLSKTRIFRSKFGFGILWLLLSTLDRGGDGDCLLDSDFAFVASHTFLTSVCGHVTLRPRC
jgi:hypothetical protein